MRISLIEKMFFNVTQLCSYDRNVLPHILPDCACYRDYDTPEKFERNVILARREYNACFRTDKNVIMHKRVRVQIGSFIDRMIRGEKVVREWSPFYGAYFIDDGRLAIYHNFSSYEALTCHVNESKEGYTIDSYFYVCDKIKRVMNGVSMKYYKNFIEWRYNNEEFSSLRGDTGWLDLYKRANDIEDLDQSSTFEADYYQFFNAMLDPAYNRNDLSNRKITSFTTLIEKNLIHNNSQHVAGRKNRLQNNRIHTTLGSGVPNQFVYGGGGGKIKKFDCAAIVSASGANAQFTGTATHHNYTQTLHQYPQDGRCNIIPYLHGTMIRTTNSAIKNSGAMFFPPKGENYLCMLNMRDIRSSGDQYSFADYVCLTEYTDSNALYRYLRDLPKAADGEKFIYTINERLINLNGPWNLDMLLNLKKELPFVTTKYYGNYVNFITRNCGLVKYSQAHNCLFSPVETEYFGIQYPEADRLSPLAKAMGLDFLSRSEPCRITVAINNTKGSVSNRPKECFNPIYENILGSTCYFDNVAGDYQHILDLAEVDPPNTWDPNIYFYPHWEKMEKKFAISEQLSYPPAEETDLGQALKYITSIYAREMPQFATNNPTKLKKYEKMYRDYIRDLADPATTRPEDIWNMKLVVAFGNPEGACIEDGTVLDEYTADHLPKIITPSCITVELIFQTNNQAHDARCYLVDEFNDGSMVARVSSDHEIKHVKHSNHCSVSKAQYGKNQYEYFIFYLQRSSMKSLKVSFQKRDKTLIIVINTKMVHSIGDGTKVATNTGQKNIISHLKDMRADLDHYGGYTRDGRRIVPQVLFSSLSPLTRQQSQQILIMMGSDNVAFTKRGSIMGTVPISIHSLSNWTNMKIFKVKQDTLTSCMTVESQNLTNFDSTHRSQTVFDKVCLNVGFLGHCIVEADDSEFLDI